MLAWWLIVVAALAALAASKRLVHDIAWHDHRIGRTASTRNTLIGCGVAAAVVFVAPVALAAVLAHGGHPGAATILAIVAGAVALVAFVVMTAAFTP